MIKKIKEILQKTVSVDVQSEEERVHIQYTLIIGGLTAVALLMGLSNHLKQYNTIAMCNFALGIGLAIDVLIEKMFKNKSIGRILFGVEVVAFFTASVIVGEPEGFSAIWMLILPTCGFFLFGMKYGMIITVSQLAILIFLLWVPAGKNMLQYSYTSTFVSRFPTVYIIFALIGILFESIRINSANALKKEKDRFEYMYRHDALTGLYNRYGFNITMDEYAKNRTGQSFAFGIFDLDLFKSINDKYGHMNGDRVLQQMAQRAEQHIGDKGIVCRWGGEEFSILFYDAKDALKLSEELLEIARTTPVQLEKSQIIETFSMGLTIVEEDQEVDLSQLVIIADDNLYRSKSNGRNQITDSVYLRRKD